MRRCARSRRPGLPEATAADPHLLPFAGRERARARSTRQDARMASPPTDGAGRRDGPEPSDDAVDAGAVTPVDAVARQAAIERAVATWTGQLIDLGGRNSLLYYKDLKV